MLFLTVLFFVLSILTILEFLKSKYKNVVFILIGLLFFLVAAFRPATLDKDYPSYIGFFESNLSMGQVIIEPSFIAISKIIHNFLFGKSILLFAIYAAIAVTIKIIAIKQLSDYWFISLLVYFSYSFILHDMTQIRAGVSVGFVLLSIKPMNERLGFKFIVFTTLAILFHYSAIIVLFLWFLQPGSINVKWYASLIVISYFASFFSSIFLANFINYLPQGIFLNKLARYEYETGTALNIFNAWQIMRCLLCFIFLWKIDLIKEHNPYAIIFLKIYIISTVTFVLLASNPTFAGRISDLFSVIDIVMLPCLLYIIRPKQLAAVLVVTISFLYFALNVFYNKIFF